MDYLKTGCIYHILIKVSDIMILRISLKIIETSSY
jgi:hypothetical protein